MTLKQLNEMLALKLENEYSKYIQDLIKNNTPEEIMIKSYETTAKEGFINIIPEKNMEKNEIQALLKEENLLDTLYYNWRKSDGSMWEILEDTVTETTNSITNRYEKLQKKQRER